MPDSGDLTWTVGLFFLNEDVERDQIRERELRLPPSTPDGPVRSTVSRPLFDQSLDAKSYAAFAQATYAVSDRFNATAGIRYTKDKKGFGLTVVNTDPANTNSLNPATSEFTAGANESWDAFTPKFTLDFSPSDDVLVYATVSRGFKSGGFTGLADRASAAEVPFAPEFAWNYEAGIKSQFANDRVQLNISGFHLDFSDLQLRQRILTIPGDDASAVVVIFNAAKAEIQGIEAEAVLVPVKGLTLSGSYTYLDSKITESLNANFLDTQLPRAPRNSYTTSGEYVAPMASGASVSFRADYRYRGTHFFDIGELAAGEEDGYGLFDGRVAYDSPDDTWTLSAWAKNLFGKQYRSHVQSVSGGAGGIARYGNPSTYGVSLTWRFN